LDNQKITNQFLAKLDQSAQPQQLVKFTPIDAKGLHAWHEQHHMVKGLEARVSSL
jgi:hypothetical protein